MKILQDFFEKFQDSPGESGMVGNPKSLGSNIHVMLLWLVMQWL